MMKYFSSFILSFIVFVGSFGSSLVLLDYQINRDFYELHCINKDKPEMNCHGKCQLKKNAENSPEKFQFVKIYYDFVFLPNSEPTEKQQLQFSISENVPISRNHFYFPKGFVKSATPPPIT